MKKLLRSLALAMVLLAIAFPVMAATVTQGEFALALIQILGFDVKSEMEAVQSLEMMNVKPRAGWRIGEPLTAGVIRELEEALLRALAEGILKPVQVEGAIAAAMAAVGFQYPTEEPQITIELPPNAPIAGTPNDPVIVEGSPYRP